MTETLKPYFENNHVKILKSNHDYVVIDKHSGYTIELMHNEEKTLTLQEIRAVVNLITARFICGDEVKIQLMQEFEKACKDSNLVEFINKEAK